MLKNGFLVWAGLALLVLLALSSGTAFLAGFETGLMLGAAAVVLVLYPLVLRGHEQRLSALEQGRGAADRAGRPA